MSTAPSSTAFAADRRVSRMLLCARHIASRVAIAMCVLGAMAFCHVTLSQEAFTPPQAYAVDRYEEGWNKNPFTLKTAPVALEKISPMQDLAIAGFWGKRDDPTVVVVDTKTGKRTSLKSGKAAENGLQLKSFTPSALRKDTSAEVTLNGETAVLKFSSDYYRQSAAQGQALAGKAENPGAPQPPGVPGAPGAPPGMEHAAPPARGGGLPTPTSPARPTRASIFNNPATQRNMPGSGSAVRPPQPRPTPGGRMLNTTPNGTGAAAPTPARIR